MISARHMGRVSFSFRAFLPAVLCLFFGGLFFTVAAENPPCKIELRLTSEPSLQVLDRQGKIYYTLKYGTVRKRVSIQDVRFLASFGEDNQRHSIIMLGLDISTNQPVSFLFGKNIIVASPEAIVTVQLSADRTTAQISPSLMGQVWLNGSLISRGEAKKVQIYSGKTPAGTETEGIPHPDQPTPTLRDFNPIPPPSI